MLRNLYIRKVPADLLKQLNVEAALRETTLRKYVVWLLTRRNYTLRALGEHRIMEREGSDANEKDE